MTTGGDEARDEGKLELFLSWSGERSKAVAQSLHRWLPTVLSDDVVPWFSERDIRAGSRWAMELLEKLEQTRFGVVCLTRENQENRWPMFEAGAVSKAIEESRIVPYLFGLDIKDLSGPLSQFQAKRADKGSTFEMLDAINAALPKPVEKDIWLRRFEAMWPELEAELDAIPEYEGEEPAARPDRDILEEIVETVRDFDRKLSALDPDPMWRALLPATCPEVARR